MKTATTLDNLQTAFNGESNARAKYLAFAKQADAEGYGKVAALFRAAARAEEIHAKNHAAAIRKMGAEPKADIQAAEVKSTRENLQVAIAGETYEYETMYAGFLVQARAEGDAAAERTFHYASEAEKGHARLYSDALAHLDAWRVAEPFYVCPVCGHTVTAVEFSRCPVCSTKGETFEKVA
jgi:rubrerythrin